MFIRNRHLKLQQYRVSEIKETENNRLVDIGDSFLALLTELPAYVPGEGTGDQCHGGPGSGLPFPLPFSRRDDATDL